ncbi:hypothetical protein [Streptomyces sp. NPDC004528]
MDLGVQFGTLTDRQATLREDIVRTDVAIASAQGQLAPMRARMD